MSSCPLVVCMNLSHRLTVCGNANLSISLQVHQLPPSSQINLSCLRRPPPCFAFTWMYAFLLIESPLPTLSGEVNPVNVGERRNSSVHEGLTRLNSRVMVAHKENMNDVLNIIVAHLTELPLLGEPNPFSSFNSEAMCTSESLDSPLAKNWLPNSVLIRLLGSNADSAAIDNPRSSSV